MAKLSDLFTYREDNKEWSQLKEDIHEGIDKVLEKGTANKGTLKLMKELLDSSHPSMCEYYKE